MLDKDSRIANLYKLCKGTGHYGLLLDSHESDLSTSGASIICTRSVYFTTLQKINAQGLVSFLRYIIQNGWILVVVAGGMLVVVVAGAGWRDAGGGGGSSILLHFAFPCQDNIKVVSYIKCFSPCHYFHTVGTPYTPHCGGSHFASVTH